jgi:hypothetical protein
MRNEPTGVRIPEVKKDISVFQNIQTVSRIHNASHSKDTGSVFLGGKEAFP